MNPLSSPKSAVRERQSGIEKKKESVRKVFLESRRFRWVLLVSVIAFFTLLLHPKMVATGPAYNLGDVAERDIKAPRDFFIEDSAATVKNVQQAVQDVMTVYDHDTGMLPALTARIGGAFAEVRSALAEDGVDELQRSVAIYGRAVSPRPDISLPRPEASSRRRRIGADCDDTIATMRERTTRFP